MSDDVIDIRATVADILFSFLGSYGCLLLQKGARRRPGKTYLICFQDPCTYFLFRIQNRGKRGDQPIISVN
jgi:hypothetical protein